MTTVYDVPADELVKRVADRLKKSRHIHIPKWAMAVKTGAHKELPPQNDGWWYVRAASMLRQIYIHGPVGVARLRTYYGGRVRRGVRKERFREASGKILRTILSQLEEAGYVLKLEKGRKGRMISPKGQSLLDGIAHEIKLHKGGDNGR